MEHSFANQVANREKHHVPEDLPVYRSGGRALGVVFENITVTGRQEGSSRIDNLPRILLSALQWPVNVTLGLVGNRHVAEKTIIQDLSGVIFPGEMMLVLGRPGAGCSSTLKVIANTRQSFHKVHGKISYSGISEAEMAKWYQSEVVYNSEEDRHFPTLTVKDTLDFSLRLRQPAYNEELKGAFSNNMMDKILSSLGLLHTKNTVVGDAYIRGVSGGERKRVSLAEVLAVNPAIASWDNPIRGLDSSSALQFLRMLNSMSKNTGMSNVVTLYQASQKMYDECFDRVMVLYEGRMIFCGRAEQAKDYFINLGFHCHERQTTPDFLTAITSPTERVVRHDHQGPVPLDPDVMAQAFRDSEEYRQLQQDIARYYETTASSTNAIDFQTEVQKTRSRFVSKTSPEISTIWLQVTIALRRYYQLLWGDRKTFFITLSLTIINGLINGSAYWMAPKDANGSFEKSGAIFFSLVYFMLNGLTEASTTVNSRDILLKQHRLGLIRPASYVIAATIGDIPVSFLQTLVFCCCYYFMVGLYSSAANFFTFFVIVFIHYCTALSLFRMLGAWSPNLNTALLMTGTAMPIVLLYSGYSPTVPTQPKWGSWIRRIGPSPWALEALMTNEFSEIDLHCTASQLIPSGPGYGGNLSYQGCPLPGIQKGSDTVSGSAYLYQHYEWTKSHLWRNFGIVLVMWFLYVVLAAVGLTIMTRETAGSSGRTFKTSSRWKNLKSMGGFFRGSEKDDLERQVGHGVQAHPADPISSDSSFTQTGSGPDEVDSQKGSSFFTFEGVSYYVNVGGEERQLLNNVRGYVKAGQLTALMGASGAGKTTLLDTISQRKRVGRVEGSMLMNSNPIDETFARSCGFCMQQDVHEPLATVREALEFSARLRQPAHISDQEKMQYVDHIISLLELEPIADAIIGFAGDGKLGVEERKRVTIGVELAARPSALLFLDEPTSGLDSQASYSIVTFLKKIAAEGIPIICTIHQPSGVLFEMFDHVLLLAPGGRTVYFGETGHHSQHIVEYFGRYGAIMDKADNPAEFILSTATSKEPGSRDWTQTWLESPECRELGQKISVLNSTSQTEKAEKPQHNIKEKKREFELKLPAQIKILTLRHWYSVWRNGPYNFSRTFKAIAIQMFIAFTFFQPSNDVQGLQNRVLVFAFLAWLIPATAADIQDLWFEKWAIFEGRERNGIYSYTALLTALILVEIPWQLVNYTLTFVCTYWVVGYPTTATISGFTYFLFLLLSLFCTGYCYLLAALFPNTTMAGYANSLLWVVLMIFCGPVIPRSSQNSFYRPWMFWADPMRYFIGGAVEATLHGVEVVNCQNKELAVFDPPSGESCYEYAANYLSTHGGYLQNPNATASCAYCSYSTGDQYAQSIGFYYDDRWRDWAVFLGFCLTNLALVYFVTWLTRSKLKR